MTCEKCFAKMNRIRELSVQGWLCPNCGWNILTTFLDDIFTDVTEYTVDLKVDEKIDLDKVRVVSKVSGISYALAREYLKDGKACIFHGKAVDVQKVVSDLLKCEVLFEVTPPFEYTE